MRHSVASLNIAGDNNRDREGLIRVASSLEKTYLESVLMSGADVRLQPVEATHNQDVLPRFEGPTNSTWPESARNSPSPSSPPMPHTKRL